MIHPDPYLIHIYGSYQTVLRSARDETCGVGLLLTHGRDPLIHTCTGVDPRFWITSKRLRFAKEPIIININININNNFTRDPEFGRTIRTLHCRQRVISDRLVVFSGKWITCKNNARKTTPRSPFSNPSRKRYEPDFGSAWIHDGSPDHVHRSTAQAVQA